jgi:hypothetical protein
MKASGRSQEASCAGRPAQKSRPPVPDHPSATLHLFSLRGCGPATESARFCSESSKLPARAFAPPTGMLRSECTGLAGGAFGLVSDHADELWIPWLPETGIAKTLTRCFDQPAAPL